MLGLVTNATIGSFITGFAYLVFEESPSGLGTAIATITLFSGMVFLTLGFIIVKSTYRNSIKLKDLYAEKYTTISQVDFSADLKQHLETVISNKMDELKSNN